MLGYPSIARLWVCKSDVGCTNPPRAAYCHTAYDKVL